MLNFYCYFISIQILNLPHLLNRLYSLPALQVSWQGKFPPIYFDRQKLGTTQQAIGVLVNVSYVK